MEQTILFCAFGLRDAIKTIVSFNHGMRSKIRVKAGIKYGMIYTLIIMFVGLVFIEIFAGSFAIFSMKRLNRTKLKELEA